MLVYGQLYNVYEHKVSIDEKNETTGVGKIQTKF